MTSTDTQSVQLSNRRHQAAMRLGVEEDKIKTHQVQLDALKRNGLLLTISVHGSSLFTRSTDWAELGIVLDGTDPRLKQMKSGQKYVINAARADKWKSIESRARQALEGIAVDITGFAPYKWLPWSAYDKFKERWSLLVRAAERVKRDIIDNLNQDRYDMRIEFEEIANRAWKQITGQEYSFYIANGQVYDYRQFIDMVIEKALAQIPTAEVVENTLKIDYTPGLVWTQEDTATDEARAAEIRHNIQVAMNERREQERVEQLQSTILEEQYTHQRRLNQADEAAKYAKIDAIRQAEQEHIREIWQNERDPFLEVFLHVRNEAAESAQKMLESIRKNGFIHGKTAALGKGLVEYFELMNIHNDEQLRQRLDALRTAMTTTTGAPQDRPLETIKSILDDIVELQQSAVADYTTGPSRFAFLE